MGLIMKENFWEGKRVLVTGATGLIGSWLTEALANGGANVTAFVKKDDPIGIDSIKHLENKVKFQYGDIRDIRTIVSPIKNQDVIFHFAAITQVIYSIRNPNETREVNVNGTANILEAMRRFADKGFLVFASTDKVYGEPLYNPIDEKHPLSSKSPYDESKLAADRLVYSHFTEYGAKGSIVRWSNTIGGRDSNILRACPDFITSVLKGKPPLIRGNGEHIRDFMFVDDVVNASMTVAEKQNKSVGEVFNFGTGKPTKVIDLAKIIIRLTGNEGKMEPIIMNKPTPGEIARQYLLAEKARKKLGWRPQYGLEDGLKKCIDWYKDNRWWVEVIERVSKYYNIKAG